MNQFKIIRFIVRFSASSAWLMVILATATIGNAQQQFSPAEQGAATVEIPTQWQVPSLDERTSNPVATENAWPESPVSFESTIDSVHQAQPTGTSNLGISGNSLTNVVGWTRDFFFNQVTTFLGPAAAEKTGTQHNLTKMLASLAIVLGVYFAFVWIVRAISPKSNSQLPQSVVQVLGRTPFGPKQNLQLVKLGSKLVLLIHGPDGAHPVGEITDPVEVENLLCQCASKGRSRQTVASRPPRVTSSPQRESLSPDLVKILRTIENAAKQNSNSVFEA